MKALRDRRVDTLRIETARRRLVDAQDAALEDFHRAQGAARALTLLARSLGGLPPEDPDVGDPLAGPTIRFLTGPR